MVTANTYGRILWSTDFESPDYTIDSLAGQQNWWSSMGQGEVVIGQKAKLGASNGYGQSIYSPEITADTSGDKKFLIAMTVQPGAGSDADQIWVFDNAGNIAIFVTFDKPSGHIKAKGNIGDWYDTGLTFTPATSYLLKIIKDDSYYGNMSGHTFSLVIDGIMVLQNIPTGLGASGIGRLYFVGGGNAGMPVSNQYFYFDNISVETIPPLNLLWAADFESPDYILNTYLTGQQGWWYSQNQGIVSSYISGQRAEIGCFNGYGQIVCTPWFNQDTSTDKRFKISFKIWPGCGAQDDQIQIRDNSGINAVNIIFERASGHIKAKGYNASTWSDTSIAYTSGTGYWLEISKNDDDHTFSLYVDGNMKLRNIACNVTSTGLGYVYFLGGGNYGTYIPGQYLYIDNVTVDILPALPVIETLWSADFESQTYTPNISLTGQQGWWYTYNTGRIVASSDRQKAELGCISNGYGQAIYSPDVTADTTIDKKFMIAMTVQPGTGLDTDEFQVIDNSNNIAIYVKFDQALGHIMAKGNSGSWYDTGLDFISMTPYRLEITKDDVDHTFCLSVNKTLLLANIATGLSSCGIRRLYFAGGGNGGTPVSNQCTYLDDIIIDVLPMAEQYAWPVGYWDRADYPESILEMIHEGGNITVGYNYPYITNENIQTWLDQAYVMDLRVIIEVPRGYITSNNTIDTALLTSFVNQFKNHSAVYGWYIADEPADTKYPAIKAGYDLIKTLSSKPVFICFYDMAANPDSLYTFRNAFDIALYDSYAYVQGQTEFYMMAAGETQRRLNRGADAAYRAGKPWWVVLQGHGDAPAFDSFNYRLGTKGEHRFMIYYSICAADVPSVNYRGSEGWLNWVHYVTKDSLATSDAYPFSGLQWINDVYKPLVKEINTLGMTMSDGHKPGLSDNQTTTLTRLFKDPATSEYYIIAVSNSNSTVSTAFTLDSSLGIFQYAQPMFENRSNLTITSRQFYDNFSRFQVHVYKLIR
jgi:hypothetical protein